MTSSSWSMAPIGDLFEIGAGKSVTPAARRGDPQHPFLRTSNVFWDRIDLRQVDRMHFDRFEIEAKSLLVGDLLVCEGGEVGRAAVWTGEIERVGFQNHLHRLRPKNDRLCPRFYVFFLQSAFTQLGVFDGAANKTTIPNLSRNRLASLEVPVPPLEEQRGVAHVLAAVRSAIDLHERIVRTGSLLKASSLNRLFTRGLRGEAQKETEIGPVPESWEVVNLGTFLKAAQYGLSVKGHTAGRYPILRMNCQIDGRVEFRDLQYVDVDDAFFEAFKLCDGDLLFNRTNSYELVGRTAIFRSQQDAVFASYLIKLRLDEEAFIPEFLNYHFGRDSTQSDLKKLASRGVSQANISASKLKEFSVPKPGIDEQREIVAILEAVDRKIDLHRRKKAVLEDLFKSLLHKLMTGEIRVGDLDLDLPDLPALAPVRTAARPAERPA